MGLEFLGELGGGDWVVGEAGEAAEVEPAQPADQSAVGEFVGGVGGESAGDVQCGQAWARCEVECGGELEGFGSGRRCAGADGFEHAEVTAPGGLDEVAVVVEGKLGIGGPGQGVHGGGRGEGARHREADTLTG